MTKTAKTQSDSRRYCYIGRVVAAIVAIHLLGISIDTVTQQFEDEGVKKFSRPFNKLLPTTLKGVRMNEGGIIS